MTTRIRYKTVEGEQVKVDEVINSYCYCPSKSGYDLEIVPTTKDSNNKDLCGLCGSYVVWTNQEEISNNGRR